MFSFALRWSSYCRTELELSKGNLTNAKLPLVARSLKWGQRDVENAQVLLVARKMDCRKCTDTTQRPEGLTFDYLAMSEKLNTPVHPSSVGLSPQNGDVLPVAGNPVPS